jgi:hexokinase
LPTGEETGTFLALDMGGTNLRVCEVRFTEEKARSHVLQSTYGIPNELKIGGKDELWDFIAECLERFLRTHNIYPLSEKLYLGLTFSYPVSQDYVDHGTLQRWTKGFNVAGVEGRNVVPMLEAAIARRVSCIPFVEYLY